MSDGLMTFDEFERDWLRRHRGSLVARPRVSSWGLISGIGLWSIIALGAALVSGAHSIPAILLTIPDVITSPAREILSLFGFTILELLIFAGSLYRRDSRFALAGLFTSLVGALAANIGSSLASAAQNGGSPVVAFVLAVIAPLAAFSAGEMVHTLQHKHALAIGAAMEVYEGRRKDLDATVNREYTKYTKTFTPVQPVHSLNSVNGANEQTDIPRSVNASTGYTKRMDAKTVISEWFGRNPDRIGDKLDDLLMAIETESGVKIGRTSIHNVRKEMQMMSMNGNGKH